MLYEITFKGSANPLTVELPDRTIAEQFQQLLGIAGRAVRQFVTSDGLTFWIDLNEIQYLAEKQRSRAGALN